MTPHSTIASAMPRGSAQTYGDTQLSAWIRKAMVTMAALAANPRCFFLYCGQKARAMITLEGVAHILTDETVQGQVFDLSPEMEQKHDLGRKGAALIVDLTQTTGFTPKGTGVSMTRSVP